MQEGSVPPCVVSLLTRVPSYSILFTNKFFKVCDGKIVEMDWSEEAILPDCTDKGRPPLKVACLPCQHWSARYAVFESTRTGGSHSSSSGGGDGDGVGGGGGGWW